MLCERRGRIHMGPRGLKIELILHMEEVGCDEVHCVGLLL